MKTLKRKGLRTEPWGTPEVNLKAGRNYSIGELENAWRLSSCETS
jgi:hypothetical protein